MLPSEPSGGSSRRRSPLRFSLLTLLAVISIGSIGLATWRATIGPYQAQRSALGAMGRIRTVEMEPDSSARWLRPIFAEESISNVVGVDFGCSLSLASCGPQNVTNADIRHLQELPHIRRLGLSETNVTDDGMKHLAGLKKLQILHLRKTKVTDEGFLKLETIDALQELHVDGGVLSEAVVERLSACRHLRQLIIDVRHIEAKRSTSAHWARLEAEMLSRRIAALQGKLTDLDIYVSADDWVMPGPYTIRDTGWLYGLDRTKLLPPAG